MHAWWQKKILPYFVFTRRERKGIYFLLMIITAMWVIPYFFANDISDISVEELEQIHIAEDSISVWQKQPEKGRRVFKKTFSPKSLFYFDPNNATDSVWRELGLSDKTIGTLQKYISRGGRFRSAEELGKIYGFPAEAISILGPYIRISHQPKFNTYPKGMQNDETQHMPFKKSYPKREIQSFPINHGDSANWESLPGIGAKLASRIIQFRSKLGGFHSIQQVSETYGLPDSTFQKIKPYLLPDELPREAIIELNHASQEELQQHPYISYQIAKLIVAYRNQHGPFRHNEDLLKIALITPELLLKISPYLKAD